MAIASRRRLLLAGLLAVALVALLWLLSRPAPAPAVDVAPFAMPLRPPPPPAPALAPPAAPPAPLRVALVAGSVAPEGGGLTREALMQPLRLDDGRQALDCPPLDVVEAPADAPALLCVRHRGGAASDPFAALSVWLRLSDGTFRLQRRVLGLDAEGARREIERPVFFRHQPLRAGEPGPAAWFLHVPIRFPGTGAHRADEVYAVRLDGRLDPVELTPAPRAFRDRLEPGTGVWKGEVNRFDDRRAAFEFHVWSERDANCCPTAGRVDGEYLIEALDGPDGQPVYRMHPAGFRVSPVEER